jgi:hypothetical protein
MHEDRMRKIRERLLSAGIAPRHVNRYVMELRDHMTDLVARERATGLDLQEAEAKARTILGTDAQLVQAMIDRGAPRSLAARAPWAVFGILPIAALLAMMILLAFASMAFFAPFRELSGDAIPANVSAVGTLVNFLGSYAIGPLMATACIAIALRQRLSSAWVWVGLVLIALASGPLGVHIYFLQPQDGLPGGIRGSFILNVLAAGRIDLATTLLVMSIRTVILFAFSAVAFRMLRRGELLTD